MNVSPSRPSFSTSTAALVAILALAFAIRIAGIDWDEGRYLHPDERHIVADVLVGRIEFSWPPERSWLDPDESPINPRPQRDDGTYEGFAYGTLPVYTVDLIANGAEAVTGVDWGAYDRAQYIGRALSILLDTGTVLLVFLIGTRLFGRYTGLAGAAVYAFLPLAIQASHFFIVDSWLTFFIFAALYTCINAVERESLWQFPLASAWFAMALASKTTAAPFGGIIVMAIMLVALRESTRFPSFITALARLSLRAGMSILAFLAVYFIGEPFAFLDPDALLSSIRTQADIQSGSWDVPFTQQYVGTVRGAYQLTQAVQYHMGPVAVLMGLAGLGGLLWLIARSGHRGAMLLAIWILGFTIVVVYPETKFPRYMLPLAPALAITAGMAIAALGRYLHRSIGKATAVAFTAVMLLISTSYGAAFAQVTVSEHTRLSASVWMQENLPPGSTTTSEIWDDRLPLSISPGHASDARRIDDASINLYSTTPTLGDIATLAPAMELLPGGGEIAAYLRAGRVEDAVELLRAIGDVDLAATLLSDAVVLDAAVATGDATDVATFRYSRTLQFQSELLEAATSMTTSSSLSQSVKELADDIAETNAIAASNLDDIATDIEAAASETMLNRIYDLLADADYYVVSSDRVQRGMEQNPWRHAVPIRMYELLKSGELGYEPVKRFQSSPSLFGYEFPDAEADETFINYDHPLVRIYEKQELVPYDRFVELFGSAALAQTEPGREPDSEPLTFDTPVSELPVVDDFRWSEPVTGNSWGAAFVWILILVVIQVAGWPLARTVFRSFPDGGWGLTRLVAIIVPATVFWWLSSTGFLHFHATWVVVSMVVFALASWLWFGRARIARKDWSFRSIATAEAVFWVTFAIFLIFKMINPDSWHPFWGGEKPMEFAQINAILRSPSFPPVDPWYAQGYINYYYYSFYLVAYLIKLTGIPVEFAFNLAQPMVMGILASGTFSVGAMLGHRITRGRHNGVLSGLIAMVLVSFAGNMMSVAQLVSDLQGETGLIDRFSHWVWAPSRSIAFTITEFPYFTGLYGDLHSHVVGMPLLVLSIALAATFAFDMPRLGTFWSRATLARLLVTIVTLGIIYPTNAWDLPVSAALVVGGLLIGSATLPALATRIRTTGAVALVVATGTFAITLPFLLHFEALFGSLETVPTTTTLLQLESHVGGLLLVATAAVPGLFALTGRASRSLMPGVLFLGLGTTLLMRWLAVGRAPDLVSWLDILTVLIVASIWLLALLPAERDNQRFDFGLPSVTWLAVAIAGSFAMMALIVVDNLVAALYLAIGVTSAGVWLRRRPSSVRFIALLVAGASFTGAGVEFVYLVDDLSGTDWARMNTVFKFYNQIWILLAISGSAAAGVFATTVLSRLSRSEPQRDESYTSASEREARPWPAIATVCTALVLALGAAYPIAATDVRLDTRFEPRESGLTLNAYSWMDYGTVPVTDGSKITFDEDRDVIEWFNTEVSGTPVIAEAAFAPYRCNSSRISIGTGLPSVLGWQRHETQQRYADVLPPRDADLRQLYASESVETKLAIINRYDVQYIVVGELERVYPVVSGNDCVPMKDVPQFQELDLDAGIETFEDMVGTSLEIAFQSGDTIVYRVVGNS